jgi:hypothetical protein
MDKKKTTPRSPDIEVEPDAWERFKAGLHAMVKAGPQHRVAKPKTLPAGKGRVRKGKSNV